MGMSEYENLGYGKGFKVVVGIDEAGRGPLAGSVVAASVVLKCQNFNYLIRDSKKLTAKARNLAFQEICEKAYIGVGVINELVIDEINILEATFLAMRNSVLECLTSARHFGKLNICNDDVVLLVDGNQFKSELPFAYRTIVKGDTKIKSISCASIVAKVVRDRIMGIYDTVFSDYGFAQHKGYPTKNHKEVIQEKGLSLIHRKSFRF